VRSQTRIDLAVLGALVLVLAGTIYTATLTPSQAVHWTAPGAILFAGCVFAGVLDLFRGTR